jgi:hypothetical protein
MCPARATFARVRMKFVVVEVRALSPLVPAPDQVGGKLRRGPSAFLQRKNWIPACAGMTGGETLCKQHPDFATAQSGLRH